MTGSLILRAAERLMIPLLLLFSLFLLLRGHHEPGGGFAGGLVAAAAFALHALANDVAEARRLLRVDPRSIVAAGLMVALASALVAPLRGRAFFTGAWATWGGVNIGTPLVFDVGVYLVVTGVCLTIILALFEEWQ